MSRLRQLLMLATGVMLVVTLLRLVGSGDPLSVVAYVVVTLVLLLSMEPISSLFRTGKKKKAAQSFDPDEDM